MPLYDFSCTECGMRFEKNVSFKGNPGEINCPRGHHSVRRIFSPPQVIFKGSGWYVADNRRSTGASSASTTE